MESVIKFETPATFLAAGPSGVGKSYYLFEVLKHAARIFAQTPRAIFYCYGVFQPLFDSMKKAISNIEFFDGVPTKEVLETWAMHEPGHKILILDDLMEKASKSRRQCRCVLPI